MDYDVIIVGTGLAGLSCALELTAHKKRVLLLEEKPYVGGRTSSWDENGMQVESGLHRVLGFYSAFPKFLKKAGIRLNNIVIWEDEIEIRLPDGGPNAVFGASPLHKPFKTISRIMGNNHMFSFKDKLLIIAFLMAGFKDYLLRPNELDQQTIFQYAKKCHFSQKIIDRYLIPLTAGIFFIQPEEYSAYAFFGLFAPYVPRLYKMRVGAFKGGMTEIMMQPVCTFLQKKGVELRTNTKVQKLLLRDEKVTGVLIKGKKIEAYHVVLATSLKPAQTILKKDFEHHPWFSKFFQLPSMSAVTIQLELEKPSFPVDRTTFGPTTHLACFAEQSRTTFPNVPGRLSIILTPPKFFLDMWPKEILEITQKEAYRLGINFNTIKNYRIISRRDDFYSLTPGTEDLRPTQKTPITGLTLAGDYTKQKYLATMEGAVVSGELAAKALLNS